LAKQVVTLQKNEKKRETLQDSARREVSTTSRLDLSNGTCYTGRVSCLELVRAVPALGTLSRPGKISIPARLRKKKRKKEEKKTNNKKVRRGNMK
jgi:hypothetical protein